MDYYCDMNCYYALRDKVKAQMQVSERPYGGIEAVKALTQEDFDLAIQMWQADYSFGRHGLIDIEGKFEGPDWYFLNEIHNDLGMEKWTDYEIESLTKRKQAVEKEFAKYK